MLVEQPIIAHRHAPLQIVVRLHQGIAGPPAAFDPVLSNNHCVTAHRTSRRVRIIVCQPPSPLQGEGRTGYTVRASASGSARRAAVLR